MSEKITGYIDHVVFRNEENGYTVMVLKTSDSEEEVTCVGTFPDITQGVTIEAEGQFSQHHVYGRQFVTIPMRRKHRRIPRQWNVILVPERLREWELHWLRESSGISARTPCESWKKSRKDWQR